MSITPVFIFSISRSGSTLLQRVLAAHEGVATVSEPWLILPQAYAFRPKGVDAEYYHPLLVRATEDFCERLPRGQEDYFAAWRGFVIDLYERAAGDGARYFIDKSPPYSLISEHILRLFPEGKFIFLWRNPLSVMASMIETWGPWRPTFMKSDLFVGLPRLVAAYEENEGRVHAARFEGLSMGDEDEWRALTDYLGIDFDPRALVDFANVELDGRMGDPTGRRRYAGLSTEPQRKWRRTLANPVRREWCRRYLRFLGARRLAVMGYDYDELVRELDGVPTSAEGVGADLLAIVKDVAKEPVRVRTRARRVGVPHVIRELLRA
jgi:hypothetical protein